jgi:hypothetical protein
MARAASRRRRQSLSLGVCLIVAVALVGGAITQRGGKPGGTPLAVAPAAPSIGLHRGAAGLHWQRLGPRSGLGYATSSSAGGSHYALSTAPGVSQPGTAASVLYLSADGVKWTPATSPTNLYRSQLAATGNRLYVGTGAANAAVGASPSLAPVAIGWSDDNASSWQQAHLPLDTAANNAVSSPGGGESSRSRPGPRASSPSSSPARP